MASFTWSPKAKRYRDTATGRYVSLARVRSLRGDLVVDAVATTQRLTQELVDGDRALGAWVTEMRATLKAHWGAQYALGRGGVNAMQAKDWRSVGGLVRSQYRYLDGFARSLAAGELSPAQALARAPLYATASRLAYERGQAGAYDGLRLPALPGQGTPCKMNCGCTWVIVEADTVWQATWTLGGAEHCDGCLVRADRWNPYIQERSARVITAA